ncbi:MAG: Sec-independent protein translocase protein TatB [Anaerolineae bacterium]|nr:Sec-independent protein translocase protein TatB [Anaerolineae bacterium]
MDILGIGFPELIFIFVIALMVFGPRRLPEIARKAGKIVADLRNMSQSLMAEWQREINAAEFTEELNKTKQEFTQARDSVAKAGKAVSQQTAEVVNSISPPQLTAASLPAQNSANTNNSPAAEPADTDNSTVEPAESPAEPAVDNSADHPPASPPAPIDPEKSVNER